MQHLVPLRALALSLLLVPAPLSAQDQGAAGREAHFLRSFEGQFTGAGRLQRAGGSSHSLSCKFSGDHQGAQVTLNGTCSTALVFSTSVRIEIRYDPQDRRYEGAFREGTGTVATLAGSRQGQTLSFSFVETAESVRPNPPARLSISRTGGDMVLTLRGTRPDQGQNLDLMLRES
jgi:hypothetical protein